MAVGYPPLGHFLGDMEVAVEVDVHVLVPLLDRVLEERHVHRDACVAHAHVQAAEFRPHSFQCSLHSRPVGHVDLQVQRAGALAAKGVDPLGVRLDVQQGHVHAHGDHLFGRGVSQVADSARDQSYFPLLLRHFSPHPDCSPVSSTSMSCPSSLPRMLATSYGHRWRSKLSAACCFGQPDRVVRRGRSSK